MNKLSAVLGLSVWSIALTAAASAPAVDAPPAAYSYECNAAGDCLGVPVDLASNAAGQIVPSAEPQAPSMVSARELSGSVAQPLASDAASNAAFDLQKNALKSQAFMQSLRGIVGANTADPRVAMLGLMN